MRHLHAQAGQKGKGAPEPTEAGDLSWMEGLDPSTLQDILQGSELRRGLSTRNSNPFELMQRFKKAQKRHAAALATENANKKRSHASAIEGASKRQRVGKAH